MAGKYDHDDTEAYIIKVKNGMDPFGVKLKKIKVQTQVKGGNSTPSHNKSIKDLQNMFSGQNNMHEAKIERTVEVETEEEKEAEIRRAAEREKVVVAGFI